jgi:hypothetical protein
MLPPDNDLCATSVKKGKSGGGIQMFFQVYYVQMYRMMNLMKWQLTLIKVATLLFSIQAVTVDY